MSESRSTREIELEGVTPDEAFAALGNEIRLDIVRVLWQADAARQYDDGSDRARTLSFSDLRRRVGVEDNGRFNYHLSELVPHFVRDVEGGYRLSGAGKRIARTVVAVSGVEEFSTEVARDCPLCGGSLWATYEDQWLRVECTRCDGLFGDEAPEGAVYLSHYPAAGAADRSPEETLSTGLYRCMLDLAHTMHGVCPECAGAVAASVWVCEDHDAGDRRPCGDCGSPFRVRAEQRCAVCGFAKRLPVVMFATGLTPVVAFLDREGLDVLAPEFDELVELFVDRYSTAVSTDPFRVTVTVHGEDRAMEVALDDDLNVLGVERRSR